MQLYTPGREASGTAADLASMREAAFSCWVFRLRRCGTRLPAHLVAEPVQGELLPIDRYGELDRFYVRLCHPGQFTDWSHEMHSVRVKTARADGFLLAGEEWDAPQKVHWAQTWLCTSSAERGYKVLADMGVRELNRVQRNR